MKPGDRVRLLTDVPTQHARHLKGAEFEVQAVFEDGNGERHVALARNGVVVLSILAAVRVEVIE